MIVTPLKTDHVPRGYRGTGDEKGEVYDLIRQPKGGFILLGVGSYKRSIRTKKALIKLVEANW